MHPFKYGYGRGRYICAMILQENDVSYEQHPDFAEFFWIDDFSEFRKLDYLRKGWVAVQDVSTSFPVKILEPQPGEMILDMCAAPGGKSAYIAQRMKNQGTIICLDRYYNRAIMLRDNLKRLQATIAHTINADALQVPFKTKFDRILLDAPCSGFGVLRKRVDLKWKRRLEDVMAMQKLQLDLLKVATTFLKEGGVIAYSTCTIEPEENEKVIEKFLKENSGYELKNINGMVPDKYISDNHFIRTFPHRHQIDGSFAACLTKVAV